MKNLNQIEKISIIKVLTEILNADTIVRDSEVRYIKEVENDLNLYMDYKQDLDQLKTLQALSIIRGLPLEYKSQIAKMMGTMIVVDKEINYNEVRLYHTFCESCDINVEFNIDDYPDYPIIEPTL
jgi:uncharacterized tellurite resistance protein B-like protein